MREVTPIVGTRRRARAREARAHEEITFDLETGELSGSLGLTGAGKTTTLEFLGALLGVGSSGSLGASPRRRPAGGRR